MKTDDAAARLEALGNPTRLQIYRALVRAGDTGMAVGKLQSKLDLAASTLSHHLKSLLIVGLISQERQATTLRLISAVCSAIYLVATAWHPYPGSAIIKGLSIALLCWIALRSEAILLGARHWRSRRWVMSCSISIRAIILCTGWLHFYWPMSHTRFCSRAAGQGG